MAEEATYGIVEVHPISHLFPMHGCKGSAWLGWQPQGLAASRFGQNLPQTGLSVFSPKTLPLPTIRSKGIRQRKQATDGKSEDKEKERLTDEAGYWCFIRKPFLLFSLDGLLLPQIVGRRQTSLLQENQVLVSLYAGRKLSDSIRSMSDSR